jgi:hypothetical protein
MCPVRCVTYVSGRSVNSSFEYSRQRDCEAALARDRNGDSAIPGIRQVEECGRLIYSVKTSRFGGRSSAGRASDCGSECRGFKSHRPPQNSLNFWTCPQFPHGSCYDIRVRQEIRYGTGSSKFACKCAVSAAVLGSAIFFVLPLRSLRLSVIF